MPDFITVPLPADLPTDWAAGQTVAPNGADAGLSEQHGYNYLMEQVNNAQTAAAQCGTAIEEAQGQIGQCIPASEKGAANGVATLDENGVLSASQTPPLDYLPLAGGTMTGAINMNSKRITNLPAPSATSDPARLADVNTRLPLAGGTMTGNINMNNKRVTNLPVPSANAEPLRRIDGVSNATATALGIAAGSLPDAAFQKVIALIDDLKTSVSNGKSAVASAITDKGVSTSATASFETMAANIAKIPTGPLAEYICLYARTNDPTGAQQPFSYTLSASSREHVCEASSSWFGEFGSNRQTQEPDMLVCTTLEERSNGNSSNANVAVVDPYTDTAAWDDSTAYLSSRLTILKKNENVWRLLGEIPNYEVELYVKWANDQLQIKYRYTGSSSVQISISRYGPGMTVFGYYDRNNPTVADKIIT